MWPIDRPAYLVRRPDRQPDRTTGRRIFSHNCSTHKAPNFGGPGGQSPLGGWQQLLAADRSIWYTGSSGKDRLCVTPTLGAVT